MSVPFTPQVQNQPNVLEKEHQHIRARRRPEPTIPPLGDPIADAHRLRPFGVSFSGGGIRSATFNLGIIQGLAENGLLRQIDYLSTVSGGGYIGAWLHAFVKNHCAGKMQLASDRLSPVDNPIPGSPHDDPVTFLRKYSNYLAPRPGVFSADTWVIGSIWLRNVLLNQLILVPSLSAVVLAAFSFYFIQQWPLARFVGEVPQFVMPVVAALLLALTLPFATRNLAEIVARCGLPADAPSPIVAESGWMKAGWWLLSTWWKGTSLGKWLVWCYRTFDDWRTTARPGMNPALIFLSGVVLGCGDTGQRLEDGGRFFWFPERFWLPGAMFLVLLFVLQIFGGFQRQYAHAHKLDPWVRFWKFAHPVWMSITCTVVLLALLHLLWSHMHDDHWTEWARVTLGPPLVCLAIMASIGLLVGLMGADYPDGAREWLARNGALIALISAGWLVFFGVAFYGPYWVAKGLGEYGKTTMAAIVAWAATGAAGVFAGRSAKTDGARETGTTSVLDRLVALAPPLVMIGYLLLISLGVHQVYAAWLDLPAPPASAKRSDAVQVDVHVPPLAEPVKVSINRSEAPEGLDQFFAGAKRFAEGYHAPFEKGVDLQARSLLLFEMLVICALVAWIASWRININEFSLHNFYKNRIVRCYLGASSAAGRTPNRLTGFDPKDDFALSLLSTERGYHGPYAIVNTTLNLNVGSELAQQERKGASFVLTPHYCGFEVKDSSVPKPDGAWFARDEFEDCGYRQTREDPGGRPESGYSDPQGPTLGQSVAISGAAASPNSGYSTSGAMAFLLTIFDARLGWWLGNPRWKQASRKPGPGIALKYLLAELTANTTARTRFVNLSDGGHFENLGLYELVKRRCRYIIVCDGEQDGGLTFGSLGGAIRKCRADFGVEIDIDPSPISLRDKDKRSGVHCVIGTIVYPEVDPIKPVPMTAANSDDAANGTLADVGPATKYARGWLLYLKSSLTGNEPADVLEYKSENPDFPHQSTGDQFFSESQFESYRRLGLHVLREAFEGIMPTRKPGDLERPVAPPLTEIFQKLTTKWYAKGPVESKAASDLNNAYSTLVNRLSDDKLSDKLSAVLASADQPSGWPTPLIWPTKEQFVFIVEQIQLMENVFGEFEFEHRARRANPRNRGWMTIFRQWVQSPAFYRGVWPLVKHSYNPVFQDFIKRLHDDKIDDVPLQN